jgi:UDP-N-acetylmuramoyl-L-alanyl-D-glutamate--2,6-diaminopimelate ligase
VRLAEVLPEVTIVPPEAAGVEISGLAYDNRRVGPGTLFFCVRGFTSDGHDYAPDAIARGAAALVVERPLGLGVPEVHVASVRQAMAGAAARFTGDPSATLRVVGITGTNGKTTTAFLVRALLEAAGHRCALLGTVKSVIGGVQREVERTTPEAIDLQAAFREMIDAGDECCAIEVSSHALELGRADAIHFAVAVFTNLTQDHLDFHPTMEDYFAAKRRLFGGDSAHVVNVDDPYGRRLAGELDDAVTFGIDAPADYRARDLHSSFTGIDFELHTRHPNRPRSDPARLPLPGRFNVSNALGAIAAVSALGVPLETILRALPTVEAVPGRFQPVDEGQSFAVLVDYAHTPDSLENVLRAARALTDARLLCVFGCGGDRDRGKRPLMGAIAAACADVAIVTSDNPRSEAPEKIIAEILTGMPGTSDSDQDPGPIPPRASAEVKSLIDRRAAIELAISLAQPGDVVVIAGKGHEQGQEFEGGQKIPFDDVVVAREALRRTPAGTGGGGR